jgi:hypothetical protein
VQRISASLQRVLVDHRPFTVHVAARWSEQQPIFTL